MLSNRLKAVADLIDKNSIVCDIGCDHAYLSIYLIENQISPLVYAVDNKIGPLNNAIINIKSTNLESKIIPVLSDGLKSLSNNNFDDIVIAGMGGLNIIEILKNYNNYKNKTLILEPNNSQYELRKYLMDNNFIIIDEKLILDQGVYYQIIKAKINDKLTIYSNDELTYGPINMKYNKTILKELLNKQLNILNEALNNSKNNIELINKINKLRSLLCNLEK